MKIILLIFTLTMSLFSSNPSLSYFEQTDIFKDVDLLKENFIPLSSKNSNFGYTNSIFWIKVELSNNTRYRSKKVLHFHYAILDYIDIYELNNYKLTLKKQLGDLRVYNNDGFSQEPSFITVLEAKTNKIFFIKLQTQGSMNLELKASNYDEYIKHTVNKFQFLMFYFGAILIMLLYNFSLYLFTKDNSYLYYVLFHLDFLLFSLSYNGFSAAYFWPELPEFNNYAVPLFMAVGSTLSVVFIMDFLHINKQTPKIKKILQSLLVINLLSILPVFVLSYKISILIISFMSFISVIIILSISLYSHFILKNQSAKFFAISWGFLLIGIFIVNAKNMTLLPVNMFTDYAAFIGALAELVLLSSALAYRYKLQEEEIAKKDISLLRQSRLASMGEMIANIAHQWRQPLHKVNLSLSVIDSILHSNNLDKEMIDKKLKLSQNNLQYMSHTIDDFTNYFNTNKVKEKFYINDILQQANTLLESKLKDVTIVIPKNRLTEIFDVKNEFLQVVLVILNNALDNFESKNILNKKIIISIQKDKDIISLNIWDNGGGIAEEDINRVFDPYYTTKFKEEGTGIGLYMAKLLVEQSMHGELSVSNINSGALFTIKHEKL